MKWLAAGLALVILLLQYRVWFSEDGVRELDRLQKSVAAQRNENQQLEERNRQLGAEVELVADHDVGREGGRVRRHRRGAQVADASGEDQLAPRNEPMSFRPFDLTGK